MYVRDATMVTRPTGFTLVGLNLCIYIYVYIYIYLMYDLIWIYIMFDP